MNIFVLDLDTSLCAQYHNNRHVVKMILESAQLLCTTARVHGIDYGYKSTHVNHPCRKWLDESIYNVVWLYDLAWSLCSEYTFRYGKKHASQDLIHDFPFHKLPIPNIDMTPFAQAMPDQYKNKDPVIAYRNYYCNEKKHLLQYTRREKPSWL